VERRVQEGQQKLRTKQKTNRKAKQRDKQRTKGKSRGSSSKKMVLLSSIRGLTEKRSFAVKLSRDSALSLAFVQQQR
jgi:hypothetical protein